MRNIIGIATWIRKYDTTGSRSRGLVECFCGITSADGKVLGLMPHPERAMEFVNLYDWPLRRERMKRAGTAVPAESMNMRLFQNIVDYFR